MPTDLNSAERSALRWTWIALGAWLTAGNVAVFFGTGTALGAILSVAGLVLTWVAYVKSRRAFTGQGSRGA